MKLTLLAATLAMLASATATVIAAEEQQVDGKAGQSKVVKDEKSEAKKPVKEGGHMEEKATTPKVMQLRDWEELFGHKPMEEGTNMPMPEPASGTTPQETMKPMQEHDMQEETLK